MHHKDAEVVAKLQAAQAAIMAAHTPAEAVNAGLTEAAVVVPSRTGSDQVETEYVLSQLSDMDQHLCEQLRSCHITTTQDLVDQAHSSEACNALAQRLGLSVHLLSQWVMRSDLMRIPSLRPSFATLLSNLEVHSVQDLGRQDPQQLVSHISETPPSPHSPRLPCSAELASLIGNWIAYARALPPMLSNCLIRTLTSGSP